MNRHISLVICLLILTLTYSAAWAQGADSVSTPKNNPVNTKDTVTVAAIPPKDSAIAVTKDTAATAAAPALDLDKLLSTDTEDALLIGDKPKVAAPAPVSSDSSSITNEDGEQLTVDETAKPPTDSTDQTATPSTRRGPPPIVIEYVPADSADLGPATVEEGKTINFAQNLRGYKSPRIAMLLSLLVPGLGQAYSKNYVKAGAFGATEVAAIGVAVYFNSVAKSRKRDAHRFADANFDVSLIRAYENRLRGEFAVRFPEEEVEGEEELELLYDEYFYESAAKKGSYYYESIRDRNFTPGWGDCGPAFDQILSMAGDDTVENRYGKFVLYDKNPTALYFYRIRRVFDGAGRALRGDEWMIGYSENQAKYNAMVNSANSYNDAVNYTLYALLLNHIASAIDAGFTARAHNAMLLNEESVWNRVSVEQQFVFTGSEVSPGLALRLRF